MNGNTHTKQEYGCFWPVAALILCALCAPCFGRTYSLYKDGTVPPDRTLVPFTVTSGQVPLFNGTDLVGTSLTVSNVSGAAPLASPTFSGTAMVPVVTSIPTGSRLVIEGDSIPHGYGVSAGEDWPSVAVTLPAFTGRVTKSNLASDGATVATLAARYTASVYPLRPTGGQECDLVVQVGSNNVRNGDAASSIATALASYCAQARTDGFKVWICTVMDRTDYTYAMRLQQSELNRRIRDGAFWDRLLDFALLGSDANDALFFADYAHPTVQGHIMLARVANAVAAQTAAPAMTGLHGGNFTRLMADKAQIGTSLVIGQESAASGIALALGTGLNANKFSVYDDGTFRFGIGVLSNEFRFNVGSSNARTSWVDVDSNEIMTLKGTGVLSLGNASPNAAAKLQVDSTTQGFLPPRMTTTQRNAMANVAGMTVYDTTLGAPVYNNGSGWQTTGGGGMAGANNLSELTDASVARGNLGLGALATTVPGTGVVTFLTTPTSDNLLNAIPDANGTGGLVFSNNAYLIGLGADTLTVDGVTTMPGAQVITAAAMTTARQINTALMDQTQTITGTTALTLSGTPATDTWFGFTLTADSSGPYVVPLPTTGSAVWKSEARGSITITSITLAASQRCAMKAHYDGSVYHLYNDPANIADLTADTAPAGTHIVALQKTDGSYVKSTLAQTRLVEMQEFCLSDETTAITTGTAKVTWRAPFAMTITGVRASLTTASSSGIPTVDINESGTTILSTKLTVDSGEKTSVTAATAAVISDSAIADDAEITFDVDVAGTGAAGLKVKLYYTR